MEDISEGAEADQREFLSRSHLGCHENVYIKVINQDGVGGQNGKTECTTDLGFLQQFLETWLKSKIFNLTQVKSPCCSFGQYFQAETIVSPGELDFNCKKGCGVEPQEGGKAISVNVGLIMMTMMMT